jgi:hypothetical protein
MAGENEELDDLQILLVLYVYCPTNVHFYSLLIFF